MRTSHAWFILVALWFVGAAGFAAAERPAKTKGRIPKEAIDQTSNHYKFELIPDYVSVMSRKGKIVGYVRKADWQDPARRAAGNIEVVDEEDLDRTIGHMVPDQGFVPLDDEQ